MGEPMPLILVSTSDIDFYLFVDHVLQTENLATHLAMSSDEIQHSAVELMPNAIMLDCRGRTSHAHEICMLIRENDLTHDIPIIALIDPSAERHYNQLIKSGIDDIFVRPVLPAKLIEWLRSILPDMSSRENGASGPNTVRYTDVEMDLVTYRVRRDGHEIHLSPIEFKLLRYFLERPEQVITREELHSAAWMDNDHVGPRTVDVHVGRLRKALRLGCKDDLIRTVRSVGYAISVHVIDEAGMEI
jgi:two-component system phosphate regulon response regulator PhoB